jgi:UDP-GlcNAc:undecaprenyl-phosphate GlcNAc-1-phosphate transferase
VTFFVQALLACLLTVLLMIWLRRPALRFGLVDHPGGRKQHGDSVPLTGGVALTLGFFIALSLSFHALMDYRVLFVAMAVLMAIGLLDDLGEVSARSKLMVQVIAAVLMTSWGNHFLTSLGDVVAIGPIALHNWAIPLTVLATVAVINGINMFDGLDGLAGGLVFGMLAWFAVFAASVGDATALKLLVVLCGAVAGFLALNLPTPWRGRRRAFMGDAGSLVLGFTIAWFSIELSQAPKHAVPPVVMLWVVGVVLFDVFTVTVRRAMRRRDPAAPDRGHIHHLLLRGGLTQTQTGTVLVLGNAALGGIGYGAWRLGVPEPWLFAAFIVLGLAYLAVFLHPGRLMRLLRRRAA